MRLTKAEQLANERAECAEIRELTIVNRLIEKLRYQNQRPQTGKKSRKYGFIISLWAKSTKKSIMYL